MSVKIARGRQAPVKQLPGRTMTKLVDGTIASADTMSLVTIKVGPGECVRPCHAHAAEEILYIVSGQGEAWVEGETATFRAGDAVILPGGCRHMIRNTGKRPLKVVCVFSPATTPADYSLHGEAGFAPKTET